MRSPSWAQPAGSSPCSGPDHLRVGPLLALLLALAWPGLAHAQDLETRRWTHLPTGTNVLGIGQAYTEGDISLDPVLMLEEAEVETETTVVSYVRSFGLFGKSARFDAMIPYQDTRWEGLLSGSVVETQRHGLADPRLRLSVNLLGAPALRPKAFQEFQQANSKNTILGVALVLRVPLGEYKEDKLLNLGNNRFVIEPQVGVLHRHGQWSYELTGSVLFFTDNDEFLVEHRREQDPLLFLQGHVIRFLPLRFWVSVSVGYVTGGESTLAGEKQDDRRTDLYSAATVGVSLGRRQGLRLTYLRGDTKEVVGTDSDSLALSWSVRF